jgi:hypothetical protein
MLSSQRLQVHAQWQSTWQQKATGSTRSKLSVQAGGGHVTNSVDLTALVDTCSLLSSLAHCHQSYPHIAIFPN